MRLSHLRVASVLVLVLVTSPSLGQPTAQISLRDEVIAEHKATRDVWRARYLAQVSATCGNRAHYDDDGLHLRIGTSIETFTDHIKYDDKAHVIGEPIVHVLMRCDNRLGLYVVELHHWEWTTVLLVPQEGGFNNLALHAEPIPSPDDRALIVAEGDISGIGPRNGIEIALRDEHGGWYRVWRYDPPDAFSWSFLGWDAPNRFRVRMGGFNRTHWESVIEFSEYGFTRSDGPKTPDAPRP